MCPESVALTILGPLTSPQGFLMPLAADDGSVGREGFAPAFSPSCCRAWGSWNRLSSELEVSVVQNLLQSKIIYWTESEIKILKEDLMSCAWVTAIQLVPGSLLTMTTTLGGPVLGQKTNSDSSFFFDIHISSLGSSWQAFELLNSAWRCSSNSVRLWIYRNILKYCT